jgi:hypothetical protein
VKLTDEADYGGGDLVNTFSGVLRDLVPAMTLLSSLIYLFANVSVTAFVFVLAESIGRT